MKEKTNCFKKEKAKFSMPGESKTPKKRHIWKKKQI